MALFITVKVEDIWNMGLPFVLLSGLHKHWRRTYPGDLSKLEPGIGQSAQRESLKARERQ